MYDCYVYDLNKHKNVTLESLCRTLVRFHYKCNALLIHYELTFSQQPVLLSQTAT